MPLSKKQTYGLAIIGIGAGLSTLALIKREDTRPGTLTIITNPVGATIKMLLPVDVEWKDLGVSPLTITLPNTLKYPAVGRPTLEISLPGYATWRSEVDIKPGEDELSVRLAPTSGGLLFDYSMPLPPYKIAATGLNPANPNEIVQGWAPTFKCAISNPNNEWATHNVAFLATVYSGLAKISQYQEVMSMQLAPAGTKDGWDKRTWRFDYRRSITATLWDGSRADVSGSKIIFQPGQTIEMSLGDETGKGTVVMTADERSTTLTPDQYYNYLVG